MTIALNDDQLHPAVDIKTERMKEIEERIYRLDKELSDIQNHREFYRSRIFYLRCEQDKTELMNTYAAIKIEEDNAAKVEIERKLLFDELNRIHHEVKQKAARRERWEALNRILLPKQTKNGSTAYSSVTWNDVKSIFKTTPYVQAPRVINDATLNLLSVYLAIANKSFGGISTGKEATRLHFIAPILIIISSLLEGVQIVTEEHLEGKFVKADGHFEFMLKRESKIVCIVEAKREDVDQGIAQDLLGLEVAAEQGGLDIVLGIVTTFINWIFLRSLGHRVERDECYIYMTPDGPDRNSLKIVSEKIYGMLS
jgi:hypothetical protein